MASRALSFLSKSLSPSLITRYRFSCEPSISLLRPLVSHTSHFNVRIGPRSFSTRQASSSLNDPSPNWSNRPPKETILLDGCDFEHWLCVMEPPEGNPVREEIIDSYIKTLASVVGSEEEARMKIYSVSTRCYYAFGALVSEEVSYKIKELPKVRWVLPDSYLDVRNKDYGGEPFINGEAVPYHPKYHEEWIRNNSRATERNKRNDRPRNYDRSRNFDRRQQAMQTRNEPPEPNNASFNSPGNIPPPANSNPGSPPSFQSNSGLNAQNGDPINSSLQGRNAQNGVPMNPSVQGGGPNIPSVQGGNSQIGGPSGFNAQNRSNFQGGNPPTGGPVPNAYNGPNFQNRGLPPNSYVPPNGPNFQNRGPPPGSYVPSLNGPSFQNQAPPPPKSYSPPNSFVPPPPNSFVPPPPNSYVPPPPNNYVPPPPNNYVPPPPNSYVPPPPNSYVPPPPNSYVPSQNGSNFQNSGTPNNYNPPPNVSNYQPAAQSGGSPVN